MVAKRVLLALKSYRMATAGLYALLVVAAAALLAAGWLHASLYAATWAGFGLFFAITAGCRPRKAFFLGAAMAGGALAVAFHWAPRAIQDQMDIPSWLTWVLYVGLVVWESLPCGIIASVAAFELARQIKRIWLIPIVWVALEYYWPKVFPWLIAHTQTRFVTLLQVAELVGASGVSFCLFTIAAIPAGVVRVLVDKRGCPDIVWLAGYSAVSVALAAGLIAFGWKRKNYWDENTQGGSSLKVAIIQVDPGYDYSIARMRDRTLAMHEQVDLACWPESTLGVYRIDLCSFRDERVTLEKSMPPKVDLHPAAGIKCELLAGGKSFFPGATAEGPFFQTVFLIQPDEQITGRYLKRTLMPIGEYVPGQRIFPGLRRYAKLDELISTGDEPAPLRLKNGLMAGILMCYEDTVGRNARDTVRHGAQALFSFINASGFQSPLTLEQHLWLSLPRAVENRRCLARCGATGISCVISPTGEILSRTDANVEATLVAEVPMNDYLTFYTRFGYLFPSLCLIVAVLYLVWHGIVTLRTNGSTRR